MKRSSNRKAHLEVTREAGLPRLSAVSVLAGLLCAYGTFAIVAAIAGAIVSGVDANTNFRSNDWTSSGAVASLVTALVLLAAYLFGGYVAGRMARRSGTLHGVCVAVASIVIGGIAGGLVGLISDDQSVRRNLRSIGVPTTLDQITDVALTGLIVSLAAIVVGALVGGMLGEQWHTKLARRAADPTLGPAAEARALAEREELLHPVRIDSDQLVRDDIDQIGERDASVPDRASDPEAVTGP